MLTANVLRHQMVLPQQQQFYDYWRSKCQSGSFPSRSDILPEDIIGQLTTTSITDIETGEGRRRYNYRLAGTGFWKLYEDEIQGQYLDELPIGNRCAYWERVLGQVIDNRRPYAGVTKPGTPNGSHMAQFWIRLPLSDNGTDINLILGYDHFVKLSSASFETTALEAQYA